MRIALVTETFAPEINGVSMTLGRLCEGLARRAWEVQVVRPAQKDEEVDLPREPSPYEELVVPGIPLLGYDDLRMGEMAVGLLYFSWKRRRPQLVHVATEGPLGLAALIAARLSRLPVSSTFHTNFDQYSNHYQVGFVAKTMEAYLRWFHNRCACTLAPTRQMADALAANGYRRTGVFSRGVDTQLFHPGKRDESLRRQWGLGPGGRAALYVGRVAREKNIELALEAFQAGREAGSSDRMIVVGGGPELAILRARYPDVVFAGMKRGEDLARHYASGDLFVFPSVTETFGNVVTEAMASGLAVLTYDYAAGRQYIRSGANGWLARFGDAGDFRSQWAALRALGDGELGALRHEARRTAESIDWDSVVAGFVREIGDRFIVELQ